MKVVVFSLLLSALVSCNSNSNNKELESRIDSLEQNLSNSYKPGLGEFMFNIQVHHAKLWFAGQNQNWKLADFEVHEIMEAIDDIKAFNTDRPEVKSLVMINAPLDSVNAAIQQKNAAAFKSGFILLTNTCNNCHQATDHGFNVIKIPDNPPVSNQTFKVQ